MDYEPIVTQMLFDKFIAGDDSKCDDVWQILSEEMWLNWIEMGRVYE